MARCFTPTKVSRIMNLIDTNLCQSISDALNEYIIGETLPGVYVTMDAGTTVNEHTLFTSLENILPVGLMDDLRAFQNLSEIEQFTQQLINVYGSRLLLPVLKTLNALLAEATANSGIENLTVTDIRLAGHLWRENRGKVFWRYTLDERHGLSTLDLFNTPPYILEEDCDWITD